jgi:hypothetical protein
LSDLAGVDVGCGLVLHFVPAGADLDPIGD